MKKMLSICLIVKNEEKRLGRCLDSLMPLMTELDAELIITDTGSTDRTVEIANQYTDRVYFFEWCDDFARARNAGIDQAVGRWVLIIDADEWLNSTDEILEFFQTDEYRKYNTAAYKIHNYADVDCGAYTESMAIRLFYNTSDMRYQGEIHEFLPAKADCKILKCFAHHIGYIYATDEEGRNKHQRNLAPLLKKLSEKPDDLRNLFHLINQYEAAEDWYGALKYEAPALNAQKKEFDSPFVGAIYKLLTWAKVKTKQWSEAEKTAQIYFEENRADIFLDMDMRYLMVIIHLGQKKWALAVESAVQYFRLYKDYNALEKGENAKSLLLSTLMSGNSTYYMSLVQQTMNALQENGQCNELMGFFEQLESVGMDALSYKEKFTLRSGFLGCAVTMIKDTDLIFQQRNSLFSCYIETLWNFTKQLYNPVLLNHSYIGELPTLARFAYYAKEAKDFNEAEAGHQTEYVRKLISIVKWNPSLEQFLNEYLVKIETPDSEDEGKELPAELQRLRNKMRTQIQELQAHLDVREIKEPIKLRRLEKPLLSIGLIVKNEEKSLARCLDSLKPLMEALDTELIITDTGSVDATVNIAKKYTDLVYDFQWCNDFAAARNYVLDHASGQWFLSIDGDEWFDDVSEIIHFFKSREYKKYQTASYRIHNYTNYELGTYTVSTAARIFKRDPNIRYQGAIHEWFPVGTMKLLECFAHHTGYEDTTEEVKLAKHQRNLEPLLAELREDPDNERTLFHLVNQYASVQDWGGVNRYKDQALESIRKKPNSTYSGAIYKVIAGMLIRTYQFKEAKETIEAYFKKQNIATVTDMDLWYFLILAYLEMGRCEETVEPVMQYANLYDQYKKRTLTNEEVFSNIVMSGTEPYYLDAIKGPIGALILAEKYSEVVSIFAKVNLNYLTTVRDNRGFWNELLEAAAKSKRVDSLKVFVSKIMELEEQNQRKETLSVFLISIAELYDRDRYRDLLSEILGCNKDMAGLLYELYGNTHIDDGPDTMNLQLFVILILELLLSDADISGARKQEIYLHYMLVLQSYVQRLYHPDILADIESGLLPGVRQLACDMDSGVVQLLRQGKIPSLLDVENVGGDKWKQLERAREEVVDIKVPFAQRNVIFSKYLEDLWIYVRHTYNPAFLTQQYMNALPGYARFAYLAKCAEECDVDNPGGHIRYIKKLIEAAKLNPVILPFLKECLEQPENFSYEKNERDVLMASEFEQLGVMVKSQIRQLVDGRKWNEAGQVLRKYETINPADSEIDTLWDVINRGEC